MLAFAWATLRERAAGFVGAFVALFCAAAMISACAMLLDTGLRGTIETERYAETPIVVAGDQEVHERIVKEKSGDKPDKIKHKSKPVFERAWIPEDTVDEIERVDGVERVIPEVTLPAYLVGSDGEILRGPQGTQSWGHGWSSAALTPFTLADGHEPRTPDELVVDSGSAEREQIEVGDLVTAQSTGSPEQYRVAGIARADEPLAQQAALFFSDDHARELAGNEGEVMAIGVFGAEGVDREVVRDRIEDALDGRDVVVHLDAERGPVEFLDAAGARVQLVSMGGAMAGTSVLVAILVVVGTFSLSIQQRHRELALLRAIAATPRQVRRLIGCEALLVGAVASMLGAGAGVPLAHVIHDLFVDRGAIPPTLALSVSVWTPLAAAAATALSAYVAARLASHRTARIRPAEALFEAEVGPRSLKPVKMLIGLAASAGGVVLLVLLGHLQVEQASTPVTFLTVIVLAAALSLLGPLVTRVILLIVRLPLRFASVAGHLAAANLGARVARTTAVVSPLVLLVAMACTVFFVQTTMNDAAGQEIDDGTSADFAVVADGPGIPAEAVENIRATDGVSDVAEIAPTTVRAGLTRLDIHGISEASLDSAVDLDITEGSLGQFSADSIALSDVAASSVNADLGDDLNLTMGDGTEVTATVEAVYARGLGFADAVMAFDRVVEHVDSPHSDTVWITASASAVDLIGDIVANYPGLQLLDRDGWESVRADVDQANAEVNYIALGLVVVFTAIAVVNSMSMATLARGREFALLRLNGGVRRQVRRMVLFESLVVGGIGVFLGTGVAAAVLSAFSAGMAGHPVPSISVEIYAAIAGAALLLVIIASAAPYRFLLRSDPAETMSER